jgi:hypothetical protein
MDSAVAIAAAAFGANAIGGIIGLVWAVAKIKAELTTQIAAEREETMGQFAILRAEFVREQRSQDHNFGEVGAAMRQYIANVEKEMHEIEIWSRDNFVLKDDFVKATDGLSKAIKDMAADIKMDFRDLNIKIDKQ